MQDRTKEELCMHLMKGDVNGVNRLLASGDIEGPNQLIHLYNDRDEGTLLMWACSYYDSHKDLSLIRALLKTHNANVDARGEQGITPSIMAAFLGLEDVLRVLVEEGRANLELRDNIFQRTPLAWACIGAVNSNEEMVKFLLDIHADVNAVSENGETPLHIVAYHGKCSIARLLLADDRVNKEAIDEFGKTPLHEACSRGYAEIVQLLLSSGADANAVEEHEDGWTPLIYALHEGATTCVQALIKAKVDVNKGDGYGQTALHHAVAGGYMNVVELLLKAKADWSARDFRNRMPLELEHRGPIESLFADTLEVMVQEYEGFRSTILRGMTQNTCVLKALQPDVVVHIAGYCDVPMGEALDKIRHELNRLRPVRRGQKRKRQSLGL